MRAQTITTDDERLRTTEGQQALIAWCSENAVQAADVCRIEIAESGEARFTMYQRDGNGMRYTTVPDGERAPVAAKRTVTVPKATDLPEGWR